MSEERVTEEKKEKITRPDKKQRIQTYADGSGQEGRIGGLQKTVGNRAVQRLLVQLKGEGSFEVDEETAERINRERESGQSLDSDIAENMGNRLGQDFSGVRVHTSPEAAALSDQLSAQAFTTGQDIFFGEGTYSPGSSGGQELLAHELTHVVQQGSGAVTSEAGKMTVNEPGDAFEQQADAISHSDFSAQPAKGGSVQREGNSTEDEEPGAGQKIEQEQEEENVLLKRKEGEYPIQRIDDEEHLLLKAKDPGISAVGFQRQAAPEEEEEKGLQTKPLDAVIQRIEQEQEEEKVFLKPDEMGYVQRQELPEEKKKEEEEI
jgi:hypothetical protein